MKPRPLIGGLPIIITADHWLVTDLNVPGGCRCLLQIFFYISKKETRMDRRVQRIRTSLSLSDAYMCAPICGMASWYMIIKNENITKFNLIPFPPRLLKHFCGDRKFWGTHIKCVRRSIFRQCLSLFPSHVLWFSPCFVGLSHCFVENFGGSARRDLTRLKCLQLGAKTSRYTFGEWGTRTKYWWLLPPHALGSAE